MTRDILLIALLSIFILSACGTDAEQIKPIVTITPLPKQIFEDIFPVISNFEKAKQYGINDNYFYSEITTDLSCRYSGEYGLRLSTNSANSKNAQTSTSTWSIQFDGKEPFDASNYNYLDIWVKGESGGEHVFVWMGFFPGFEGISDISQYINISSKQWKLAHIPLLSFFPDGFDEKSANVWLTQTGAIQILLQGNSTQSICIDNINFSR